MLKIVIFYCLSAAKAAEFQITNNEEAGDVWVGIQAGLGKPELQDGGFVLGAGQMQSVQAPDDWAGQFWARTDCGNKQDCDGAVGAPPVTLAEITLKGIGGSDYYDISLVDGFNVPISIEPVGGQTDDSPRSCRKAACLTQLNTNCPDELTDGTVGCKSACEALNTCVASTYKIGFN